MKYNRTYNFSAGPAMMPEPVLEEIRDEMMNYRGSGMCVMEMSHRSKVFQQIIDEAEADLWLVEWPERGGAALPPLDLRVALDMQGQGRRARLQACSPAGQAWLSRLGQSGHLQGFPAV